MDIILTCILFFIAMGAVLSIDSVERKLIPISIFFLVILGFVWIKVAHNVAVPHESIYILHNHIENDKLIYQYVNDNNTLINITNEHGSIIYSDKVKKIDYNRVWSLGVFLIGDKTIKWEPVYTEVENE